MSSSVKKCTVILFIYSFGIFCMYYAYNNIPDNMTNYIKATVNVPMNAKQKVESVNHHLESGIKGEIKEDKQDTKLILIYTKIYQKYDWGGTLGQINKCPITNCKVAYDKSLFLHSDLVVFHGRNLPGVNHTIQLHSQRPPKQRWAFYLRESPINTPSLTPYNGMFNWTATYRFDSDVFWPITKYHSLKDPNDVRGINFAEGKTKMVAIMYSHCVPYRTKIVKALLDLNIPVDTYGTCNGNERVCGWHCPGFFKDYKFYLAFENTYCQDYITEKYWNALSHNMIPVVIGSGNYSNPNLAVPNSFINALDFDSIQDLADYLKYLDNNDTAYNQYFTWRENYYLGNINKNSPYCKWCEWLNDANTPPKIYHQISDFWGRDLCEDVETLVDSILF